MKVWAIIGAVLATPVLALSPLDVAGRAIDAFTTHCFTKGMTPAQAAERILRPDVPFVTLDFYDTTLEPADGITPGTDRRCEVRFPGNYTTRAQAAVQEKMAQPPVFGQPTAMPPTHASEAGTTFIEARELLRGRIAVVHIGYENGETFINVERLTAAEDQQ